MGQLFKSEDEIYWQLSQGFLPYEVREYFPTCQNHDASKFPGAHPLEFRSIAIAHMWRIIVTNYTHTSNLGWNLMCWSGSNQPRKFSSRMVYFARIMLVNTIKLVLDFPEFYSLSFLNDIMTLRFVSCGRRAVGALAFHELLNVFHWQVWLAFLVTLAASILFKTIVADKSFGFVVKNCFEFWSIFLEQDARLTNVTRLHKWRIFMGLYVLVNIVLSHAYRNTNVYKMVQPRAPIPYETFAQVINDGFQIFSRNVDYSLWFGKFTGVEPIREGYDNSARFQMQSDGNTLSHLRSEVEILEDKRKSQIVNIKHNTSDYKIMRLKNNSRLLYPSNFVKIFTEIGQEYLKLKKHNKSLRGFEPVFRKMLKDKEQLALEKALRDCNKVALILPDHITRKVARKYNHLQDLYIGKESLQDSVIGFKLEGYIPSFVLSRIRAITWAGIWNKWEKLVWSKTGRSVQEKKQTRVHKATMSGNIFILFVLLLCGEACSIGALFWSAASSGCSIFRGFLKPFEVNRLFIESKRSLRLSHKNIRS